MRNTPLANSDHAWPEWEAAVIVAGCVIGAIIIIGSFVQLFLWYFH
jgi:hypothetical protein